MNVYHSCVLKFTGDGATKEHKLASMVVRKSATAQLKSDDIELLYWIEITMKNHRINYRTFY